MKIHLLGFKVAMALKMLQWFMVAPFDYHGPLFLCQMTLHLPHYNEFFLEKENTDNEKKERKGNTEKDI